MRYAEHEMVDSQEIFHEYNENKTKRNKKKMGNCNGKNNNQKIKPDESNAI